MTLTAPEGLYEAMRRRPEISWNDVACRAFKAELATLARLEMYDRLLANSVLTEQDAIEIGREINHAVSRKARRRVRERRKK